MEILKNNPSTDDVLTAFFESLRDSGLQAYDHQEEAIMELFQDKNVILNTPTGSGKSLVAEAVHYRGLCQGRRSFYTVPIKALANEKFLSLCKKFGAGNVGMITGDATVNGEAPIICCTAEILSNLALREGATARVDDVIMDEFHYYSDHARGGAWQIPLLSMPQAKFLLISATIGETAFFQKKLKELTGAETVLVQSDQRPVPLEFSYSEIPLQEQIQELVDADKAPIYLVHFTQRQTAESANNLLSANLLDKEEKSKVAAQLYGHDFKSPYGQEVQKLLKAGIGIHHAGLLPKYRILVEKLTQQGLLKVVCGTDTLGVGVNVPIRSVLFTGLSKYDGTGTKVLTVRDFKQIAGRAGRRGFDTVGYVVAQAPEHDIENIKLAQKTNKKGKPLQKRKAPDGFVGWSEQTFRKLIDAAPEKLVSSFQVRHNTLLNVFSREYEDGCFALKQLINGCHEPEIRKIKHRKNAWALFRGLVEGKVLEIIPPNQRDGGKKVKLNLELPEDFSMNQALGLWLMEALTELDREDSDYALNVISLVEAILENPSAILNQQERKMKDLRVAEMKQEGLGYDERMSILEEMSYPKPGEGFIYDSYNRFRESNPWVAGDSVRPKSIVRELIENYHSFAEYVKKYGLERSEGVFLRHLSEVYKVLTQTIPTSLKNEELIEAEVYLDEMLSEIDSSLVDEWKKLSNPDYDPEKEAEKRKSLQNELKYTDRKSVFHRALRQQSFAFVEAWAKEQWSRVFNLIERADPVGQEWARVDFEDIIDEYYENHENVLTDPEARSAKFFRLKENPENADHLYIEQTLTDPDGANDWMVKFEVSKNKCDEAKKVVLSLVNILPIGE